jgi:adenosylcobinamide-GDP ribazoletransferase
MPKIHPWVTPFLMAIALLTRIPVTQWLPEQWQDSDVGRSAVWYPVVGLVIASIMAVVVWCLPEHISPWIAAMLLTILWVGITGALHVDGVADCVDAIHAGHGLPSTFNVNTHAPQNNINMTISDAVADESVVAKNPKRDQVLHVLKDPTVGAMAVVAVVLLLMSKTVLLASLWLNVVALEVSIILPLCVSMSAARTVALLFMMYTPYTPHTQKKGLGAAIVRYIPKKRALLMSSIFVLGLSVSFLMFASWLMLLFVLLVMLAVCYVWRSYWLKTVDGFVGDSVGALIEMTEVIVLFLFYCALL